MEKKVNQVLTAPKVSADRPPDEKTKWIRSVFQVLQTKRTAPEFIQPSLQQLYKNKIVEELKHERQQKADNVNIEELMLLCSSYKHPAMGTLTGLKWIYFTIYHTERHLQQLKMLKRLLQNS